VVISCGIDIEELSRFSSKLPSKEAVPAFSEIVFTRKEIEHNLDSDPHIRFPLCFCCKEAFFKALGGSWTTSDITWKDIELLFNDKKNINDFNVRLNGFAQKKFELMNCGSFDCEIEYNDEFVVFHVILYS
jgi:phosphopantetheine--protein transferase-like protein